MYNRCFISGRLVRNPILKTISQSLITTFTLIVNTEVEKPLFIEVDVWGVKAKYVADNFKSGDLIFIEGFLRLKEWQKDGIDFRKIVLIAENIDSGGPAKPFCDYLTRALKKIKGTIRQDELRRLDDSLYLEHESKIMNESKHQYRD